MEANTLFGIAAPVQEAGKELLHDVARDAGRSLARGRPGRHRLLPIAGGGVAVAAVLAHLGGGALVMHVGLPAALVYLGLGGTRGSLNGGALLIGIVMFAVMMLLMIVGARHWVRHR